MKPLQEETVFMSDAERALAALVAHVPAHTPSPFRKRLVRTRIEAASRRKPGLVRYAPLAALLVCTSAAAATFGYRYVSAVETPAEPAVTKPAAARALSAPKPVNADRAEAPELPAPAAKAPAPERPQSARGRVTSEREKAKLDGEDPSQMLEAVRALRKEGNPQHAQKLLDAYLTSHPSGALSEDALALSIEAASARRDPRAAVYARRYLAQYPNGRFRQLALKAANADR